MAFRDLGPQEAAENIVNPVNAPHPTDGGVKYTEAGTPYLQLPQSQLKTDIPIYITPHFHGDGPAQVKILSDERVNHKLISPPWPFTIGDAEAWINLNTSTPEMAKALGVLRAYHPGPEGEQIGGCDLHPVRKAGRGALDIKNGGENEYELGYLLGSEWQGKGIMRVAAREMVSYGREVLGVQIICRVAEVNAASRAVVEGMKEFVRTPERDSEIEWPENKGGGTRKLLFFKVVDDASS